jgi:hypothetical protein
MKTIKKVEIIPVFVKDCIPNELEFGKLYISEEYHGCSHLCLCGCGVECYLSLNYGHRTFGWDIVEKGGKISLTPSILQRFECKSHYIITNNVANFV